MEMASVSPAALAHLLVLKNSSPLVAAGADDPTDDGYD